MKKVAFLFMVSACCTFSLTGCDDGGGENRVIEAPPQMTEEQPAMEGMSDEEYDQAMEADLDADADQ